MDANTPSIVAIDPGTTQSGAVHLNHDGHLAAAHKLPNEAILAWLRVVEADVCVIEDLESYGKPVGREVFATGKWIGRFSQAWLDRFAEAPRPLVELPRSKIKRHLCGGTRARDTHVRTALIQRYGGQTKAIGCKAAPGPLYGVRADAWSALAIATTYADLARLSAAQHPLPLVAVG